MRSRLKINESYAIRKKQPFARYGLSTAELDMIACRAAIDLFLSLYPEYQKEHYLEEYPDTAHNSKVAWSHTQFRHGGRPVSWSGTGWPEAINIQGYYWK